jgi:hypothetical protein
MYSIVNDDFGIIRCNENGPISDVQYKRLSKTLPCFSPNTTELKLDLRY